MDNKNIFNAGIVIRNDEYIILGFQRGFKNTNSQHKNFSINGFGGCGKINDFNLTRKNMESDETITQLEESKNILELKNYTSLYGIAERKEETAIREFLEELFCFKILYSLQL